MMSLLLSLSLLAAHFVLVFSRAAIPPVVRIDSLEDLGDVTTEGVEEFVARDLGFSGTIGGTIVNVYGDSFHANKSAYPIGRYDGTLLGFIANSAAIGDPLTGTKVHQRQVKSETDTNGGKSHAYKMPDQFCPFTENEQPTPNWGLGLTAVQDVDGISGVIYTLKLYRGESRLVIRGAGIARVDNLLPSFPTCTRLKERTWNGFTQPWYGTYGTLSSHGLEEDLKQYIYAFGQANATRHGDAVYVTRVPRLSAFEEDAYQYWNGSGWQKSALTNPESRQAVRAQQYVGGPIRYLPNSGQASFFWSNHHNCYLMLEGVLSPHNYFAPDNFIQIRTSYRPEGPWSAPVLIAGPGKIVGSANQAGSYIKLPSGMYAPAAMPYYDSSGKTLQFTFTYGATVQRLLKITFQ